MKTKQIIITVVIVAIIAFLLYNSVYIMSLTEREEQLKSQTFDPEAAIKQFRTESAALMAEKALALDEFDRLLVNNPEELIENHGNTLGIGAPYSIVVSGEAEIIDISDELLKITSPDISGNVEYFIRISSIFSNTIREASGMFALDKFETTMDFNLVTLELNSYVENEVVEPVRQQFTKGAKVTFTGAADVSLKKLPVKNIEIVPVKLMLTMP